MLKDKSTLVRILFPLASIIAIVVAVVLLNSNRSIEVANTKQWKKTWQSLQPFRYPRRGLTAIVVKKHMYVIGGVDGNGQYVKPVEVAQLHEDGTLGHWRTTSELNEGRFYLASGYAQGYVYALGGANGPLGADNVPSALVERAAIQTNGMLGSWEKVGYLTTPRRGVQAVSFGNRIYAIGGYNGIFLHSVEKAEILPNLTIPIWQQEKEQSITERYIHSATIHLNHLYLLGGHVKHAEGMSYGDVEMSTIGSNGQLSPWHIEQTRLKIPRFLASSFSLNHYLYILGGHNGSNRLKEIEFANIDPNGHVSSWQFTAPLSVERSAATTAVFANYVYALGGMSDSQVLNSVEFAMQGPAGQLGHFHLP